MSYPYQQGPPQSMPGMSPYPQQQNTYPPNQSGPYPNPSSSYPSCNPPYPGGPAPYPQQSNVPYPTQSNIPYPSQSFATPSPYPPQMGFGGPVQMPMPIGHAPSGAPPNPAPYGGQPTPAPYGGQPTPFMGQTPSYGAPYGNTGPSFGNPSAPSYGNNNTPSYGSSSAPNFCNPPVNEQITAQSRFGSLSSAPPTHGQRSRHCPQKYSPTVLPADPFDARADAEILRKAMKGFGTDEKAIIQVLANRVNMQRLQIAFEFKTLYGKDLINNLKSEISGRFEDLVVAMMTPLPQFYAQEIHDALSGVGTDEDTLIEVFCTMSNDEIHTIRAAYESMFHMCLEDALVGDTSGCFRRLMVSLVTANRDESMMVDSDGVTRDAQALLRAGELRMGTDESVFNAVLCQRNWAHLRCVFEEYERITGHDFEKAVKNEFSGDIEEGLLAIVRSIKDRPQFFARRLHQSMKGLGTNDKQLIRLVVTRSEVDMGAIKEAYQAKYGESLADAIKSETSGDYKKCLEAMIS